MSIAEPLEPRRLLATFTVTSTADSGPGTLRAAILSANADPDADRITFNLPDPAQAITPTSALPDITHPVGIDGATQPGFTGTPLVRIDGRTAGPGVVGLRLIRRVTLREVAVINFSGDGVGRNTADEGTAPNNYTVFKDVNANGNVGPTDIGIVRGNTGANVSDVPQPAGVPRERTVSSITSDLFSKQALPD